MDWSGKKVLVTGACGFIGSHLVEELVRRGADVKAFIFYNSFGSWGWLDRCADDVSGKFEVFMGDIRDPNGVREAVAGCDTIFHLAALIGIPYSYHSPDMYIDTNIKGTLNVMQAARASQVRRVVHTSTSEVYGSAQYVPIDELHPLVGQSPYSASKIGADQLALSFHKSFETPLTIMRPFNTYGPRQSARAVIPTVITQIQKGARTIKLGNLDTTRDFSFVLDTVAAFIALAETEDALGEVVNFGSGFEISIKDTVEIISDLLNSNVKISVDVERVRPKDSEVERLFAGTKKIENLVEWRPAYAGLDGFKRGLKEVIDWYSVSDNSINIKSDIYNI